MAVKTIDPSTHRAVRVGRLETIGQMKSECGRVFREMRRGTLSTADGMRCAQVLLIMMGATRDFEWEQKIIQLEDQARANNTASLPILESVEVVATTRQDDDEAGT